MSTNAELYVNEDCSNEFKLQLDEYFGKDKWELNGSDFNEYFLDTLPKNICVRVFDKETKNYIGEVKIYSKPIVDEIQNQRFITMEPIRLELLKKIKHTIIIEIDTNEIDPMIAKNSLDDLTNEWKWVKNIELK